MSTYLTLILLWTAWCIMHSTLISQTADKFFKSLLKDNFRYFRLLYNGFALVTIVPILTFSQSLKNQTIFTWDGILIPVWMVMWVIVVVLVVKGVKAYPMSVFLGVRQALSDSAEVNHTLSTHGILGIVRHPWYLAALLFLWVRSYDIHLSMIIENLVLTLYLIIGVRLEEKKLINIYGNQYRNYQNRVSALIPIKWFFSLSGSKE